MSTEIKLEKVTVDTIPLLYSLNKEMAEREGQSTLFTAKIEDYKKIILVDFVDAFFILLKDEIVGFIITQKKAATYLGNFTLYVEDIYLKNNFQYLFSEIIQLIQNEIAEKNIRIEIRLLTTEGYKIQEINKIGFEKITKWNIFRS